MDQRELLARLGATPRTLAHLVVEADDARLDAVPPEGGWSPRTILAHLRDDEFLCMRPALGRMLALDSPDLFFMDGSDWEPGRNRVRDRKETLLGDFALQRQATLNVFACLRESDWERRGNAWDGEAITILQLLSAWVGHDAAHVAQLEQALGETLPDVLQRRAHPQQ